MSKLISADLPRVLKSRLLYVILLITVFLAAVSVVDVDTESVPKEMICQIAIQGLFQFLALLMPIFSGGLSIMIIASEFSSGVIRNKLIMGHNRKNILFSWMVIYSAVTFFTYLVYIATYFIALLFGGADLSTLTFGTVLIHLLIVLLFVLKFQLFCLLMVCIYPDQKMAVICYLLNNLIMVPVMLLSSVDEKSKVTEFLSRTFLLSYVSSGQLDLSAIPDKPWLTILCTALLGAVYAVLAAAYFSKKDLK